MLTATSSLDHAAVLPTLSRDHLVADSPVELLGYNADIDRLMDAVDVVGVANDAVLIRELIRLRDGALYERVQAGDAAVVMWVRRS